MSSVAPDPSVVGRRRQRQPAALRHRAQSVGRQIPDDLPNLVFVGFTPDRFGGHINGNGVILVNFGAVAQQERGVLHDLPDVQPRQLEPLRARVGEKRLDRVVEPLRFAEHDVHELRLLVAERQFLPEHLDRARHRGQRIADLVRNAGSHFADGCHPLLQTPVALEPPHVGDILEGEEESRPAVWKRQRTHRETELDRAPVAGAMLGVDLEHARVTEAAQTRAGVRRQLQHVDARRA